MYLRRNLVIVLAICAAMSAPSLVGLAGASCLQSESAPPASASSQARAMGTVKAVAGDRITLGTDSGAEVTVLVPDSTRIVRVAPGQKDLPEMAKPFKSDIIHAKDFTAPNRAVSTETGPVER